MEAGGLPACRQVGANTLRRRDTPGTVSAGPGGVLRTCLDSSNHTAVTTAAHLHLRLLRRTCGCDRG